MNSKNLPVFKRLLLSSSLLLASMTASAFTVKTVTVDGLNSVDKDGFFFQVKPILGELGESGHLKKELDFTVSKQEKLINDLYKTGLYKNISLYEQDGNHLVISVVENPVYGQVQLTGNKKITSDKILPILKKMKITSGNVISSYTLQQITSALQQQYQAMGYEQATVKTVATASANNPRIMNVNIVFNEGSVSKIKSIVFQGNKAFSSRVLRQKMSLSSSGLLTFITGSDQYSKQKLSADIEKLKAFYQNHGYRDIKISPPGADVEKKAKAGQIGLVLKIDEGPLYYFGRFSLNLISGNPGNQFESQLGALIKQKSNQLYSLKSINSVVDSIKSKLDSQGFATAIVQYKVDDAVVSASDHGKKKVNVTFSVNPGAKAYVRQISFSGNTQTQSIVLRKYLLQMEGQPYSKQDIQDSIRMINNTGFISVSGVKTVPVAGKNNQVDLVFEVVENKTAGKFTFSGGYSQLYGPSVGAALSQPNFIGTGDAVSLNLKLGKFMKQVALSLSQPKLTANGLSRNLSLDFTQSTPDNTDGQLNYGMQKYGLSVGFGVPVLMKNTRFDFSSSLKHIMITDTNNLPDPFKDYTDKNGDSFLQPEFDFGWTNTTLNQQPFPTSGGLQSLDVNIGIPQGLVGRNNRGLGFYKLEAKGQWYIPLYGDSWILSPHYDFGFGQGFGNTDDKLPFFNNFIAGGIDSVPGFQAGSLGPYYKKGTQQTQYLGGNLLTVAGVNLIFPNPFSENLRTAFFFDMGNVFDTSHSNGGVTNNTTYQKITFNNVPATIGILAAYRVPMIGAIKFSIGEVLRDSSNLSERHSQISFSIGGI